MSVNDISIHRLAEYLTEVFLSGYDANKHGHMILPTNVDTDDLPAGSKVIGPMSEYDQVLAASSQHIQARAYDDEVLGVLLGVQPPMANLYVTQLALTFHNTLLYMSMIKQHKDAFMAVSDGLSVRDYGIGIGLHAGQLVFALIPARPSGNFPVPTRTAEKIILQ